MWNFQGLIFHKINPLTDSQRWCREPKAGAQPGRIRSVSLLSLGFYNLCLNVTLLAETT